MHIQAHLGFAYTPCQDKKPKELKFLPTHKRIIWK